MANTGLTGRDLRNAILFGAVVYLVIRFITLITDVLLLFSVTLIAVTLLNPIVAWISRHKIPRSLAAGTVGIGIIGLMASAIVLIIPPATEQFRDMVRQVQIFIPRLEGWISRLVEDYPFIDQYIGRPLPGGTSTIKSILGGATAVTAGTFGTIAGAALVFITTVYVLADPAPLAAGFVLSFDPIYRTRVTAAGARLSEQIKAWGVGVLIGMLFIFLITWAGLSLIGIRQAFLFAVIAGLMEAVPVVGPLLSAVPPIIAALVQNPILAVWVAVLFILVQQIEGHLLIPMIMSHQLRIHPVTVVFWVLVMGGLFGIIGIFLAMPVAVTARVVYEEFRFYKSVHPPEK